MPAGSDSSASTLNPLADNAAEKELATAQETIAALEEQVATLKQAASTTASGEASGTAK